MTDVVKMCDVIDNCTECPRYGDDCDGDKRLYTHEEAWGMRDIISRADAIEAVENNSYGMGSRASVKAIKELPSAETHEIRTETHGVCLIRKDDAMGAVQDHFNADGFKGYDDGQKMMDRINKLPSADAVEVVRCKDCKYGETSEVNKYYIECKLDEKPTFVDGFCSYGKRKTQPKISFI